MSNPGYCLSCGEATASEKFVTKIESTACRTDSFSQTYNVCINSKCPRYELLSRSAYVTKPNLSKKPSKAKGKRGVRDE